MIHDVDESLRDLLEARIVRDANIEVTFDAPTKEWAGRRQGPAINAFLYDIREDLERRHVQFEPVRDGDGIVTARETPPRRFKLEYLLTCWAQRAEDEHRMLSAVLELFAASDAFPEEFLRGRISDVGPIRTTVALPLSQERSLSDIWSALGGGLRPTLTLMITVPLAGRADPIVGPPVLEGPLIRLEDAEGRAEEARRPASRKTDGPKPADQRPPAAREVIDAGRFRRGRIEEVDPAEIKPGRRIGMSSLPRPRGR